MTLQTVYPQQPEHWLKQADCESDAQTIRNLRRAVADMRDVAAIYRKTIEDLQAQLTLAEAQTKQAQEEAAYAMNERDRAQVEKRQLADTLAMARAQVGKYPVRA